MQKHNDKIHSLARTPNEGVCGVSVGLLGVSFFSDTNSGASTKNVAEIMNSAKTIGITRPVDVFVHNGTSYIINGHHRVQAAIRLGQNVPVNYLSTPGKVL